MNELLLSKVFLPMVRRGKSIPLGTCVHPGWFSNPVYVATLTEHYQEVTPEVAGGYWWVVDHGWGDMDAVVLFAEARGMEVFYHPLRWWYSTQPPDIETWITEAMTRYPGIYDWVVVNEGWKATGAPTISEIDTSFEIARRVRPNARLWYNGLLDAEPEQKWAQWLLSEGLADAVGIQGHLVLASDITRFIPFLEWVAKYKVPWRITELDVVIPDLTDESLQAQADMYRQVVQMCTGYGCESVHTWGVADCVSWKRSEYPLPLDVNYQPKPAWEAIETLQGGAYAC